MRKGDSNRNPSVTDAGMPSPPQASVAVRLVVLALLVLMAALAIWVVNRKASKDQPGHRGIVNHASSPFAAPR